MIDLVAQGNTFLAAPINFNVDGLGNLFWQLTVDGLAYGAIYALVAVGYSAPDEHRLGGLGQEYV